MARIKQQVFLSRTAQDLLKVQRTARLKEG